MDNSSLELMWGAPGTALAALVMYKQTNDEVWADLFRQSAAEIQASLELDENLGCSLWSQELYGAHSRLVGAVHGYAGNVFPFIRGRHLLTDVEQSQWSNSIVATMNATAVRENGCANWPQSVGEPRPGRTALLVQHCHGAPGVVNCLAELPSNELDQLLIDAGELTWKAGPPAKGAGLCHGTAGNGYAFLKLYKRIEDSAWLDRARAFAMHAIGQFERHYDEYGRGRYSLWTGDQGVAIYLWSCLEANADFPTMDVF